MPHFEQDSVLSCTYDGQLEVTNVDYPWIAAASSSIPTYLVSLKDNVQFRFGSLIGLNKTIEKIASSVSAYDSSSTQNVLFMGLPSVLEGRPAPGISKVENSILPNGTLFLASRNLVSASGLIFTIQAQQQLEKPIVLRVGIGDAKQRTRLLGVMGIRQSGGKRRQS